MFKNIICFLSLLLLFSAIPARGAADIRLGAIFAKTGEAAGSNKDHLAGLRFAVKEINANGGVLGRQIKLLEYDNHSTQIGARMAAQKAVSNGVFAVVGNSWSSHSLASAPVLQHAGIVMLSPDSTNPQVTAIGSYIFRSCFTDPFQGMVLARFATGELHAKRAAIMVDVKSVYSIGLANYFTKNFVRMGGKIITEQQYTHDQRDFSKQLAVIKSLHPEVIFIPGHDESVFIARQARKMGVTAVPLFGDGMDYSSVEKKGLAMIKIGFFTTHWDIKVASEASRRFVSAIRKAGNIKLSSSTALTYDSVYLLKNAIVRANSIDPKAIRDALAQTHNYKGVTGTFNFNKQGDPTKNAVLMEIKDGRLLFHEELRP
ncbi:MAG: ABC transporter substrate-binding protein [Deltaproteobacteria bacterium]|nr:ABC transporter substrate-binding protein [Deltaproteobacteria bacterium]